MEPTPAPVRGFEVGKYVPGSGFPGDSHSTVERIAASERFSVIYVDVRLDKTSKSLRRWKNISDVNLECIRANEPDTAAARLIHALD